MAINHGKLSVIANLIFLKRKEIVNYGVLPMPITFCFKTTISAISKRVVNRNIYYNSMEIHFKIINYFVYKLKSRNCPKIHIFKSTQS